MSSPRLLPWPREDGKSCYLSPGEGGSSFVTHLADAMEVTQVELAEQLLGHVDTLVSAGVSSESELRQLVSYLCMSLRDVVRVAESRGARLPRRDHDKDDDELYSTVQAIIEREITMPWTVIADALTRGGDPS
jgi:hypothetical protein